MAKKNKSTVDKIVMGAIVGAAIGSVIGSAVAPEKGEKTRKKLRNKAEDIAESVKERNKQVLDGINKERKKRSLLGKVFGLFFKPSAKKTKRIPLEEYEHEEV
jgi:gas vesicle protein